MGNEVIGFNGKPLKTRAPVSPRVDFQVHVVKKSGYGLESIFVAMELGMVDAIGISSHPGQDLIPGWLLQSETGKYQIEIRERSVIGVNKETGRELCLIFGQEIMSSDDWHLLDIGGRVRYDEKNRKPLESYIDNGLEMNEFLIFAHPFADPARRFLDVRGERARQLEAIMKKYGTQIAYDMNGYCLDSLRKVIPGCSDINSKLERKAKEHGLRVVPTSDTHARNGRLLYGIGAASITFNPNHVKFGDEDSMYGGMKTAVQKGHYTLNPGYVGIVHWGEAFGWPMVKGMTKRVLGIK